MKAIYKLISLPAVLLAASCAQELPSDSNGTPGDLKDVVLEVSMPDTPMTRTVLGDKENGSYPVFWQEGDIISLNGFLSSAVTADGDGNDSFAFNVKASSMSAPYTVLYPGNEDNQVVLGQEQEYVQGTFAANTLPMYAQVSSLSSEVSLDYLASVLRIPVRLTSATSFKRIEVTAPEGEPLCGTFSIEDGTLAGVETSDKVSYTFGEEGTAFAAGEAVFHIVVPAGTYAGGLELRFYDTEGNYMIAYAFGEDKTVAAGKVYEFAERTFFPDGQVFLISTPADMLTFATKSGESHALLQARLTADIDMSGVEYNSDSFNFYGTLDGAGNSITGLTTSLFNNLYGTVRDLEITADVEYTATGELGANNPYGIGLLAHYVYSETGDEEPGGGQIVENVTVNGALKVSVTSTLDTYNIGGVVGASNGVPMTGCVNNATVTVENYAGKLTRVGGIAGALQKSTNADLTGCTNAGAITLNSNTVSGALYLGGIAGYMTQAVTLSNCVNDAAVSVAGTPCEMYVGGMFGGKDAVAAKLLNCTNTAKGAVTVSGDAQTHAVHLAGVIAHCPGGNAEVDGCVNHGAVTNNISSSAFVDETEDNLTPGVALGGVVGRINSSTLAALTNCENYGTVTNNCNLTDSDNNGVRMGGIVGYTHQPVGDFSNCTNYGNVTNNGSAKYRVLVAGVLGYNRATLTIYSCSNQGTISNSANTTKVDDVAAEICMGGIVAHVVNKTTTITKCTNGVSGNLTAGAITNTGVSEGNPSVRIGGLVGFADVVTKIGASGADRSVNYGSVSNVSATTHPAVGGVVGYTNKASDLSNVCNEGAVSISGNVEKAYLGGVLGYAKAAIIMDNASSSGNLTIYGCEVSLQLIVGGVVGMIDEADTEKEHVGLTNSGTITISSGITSTSTSYNYIGGICGSSEKKKKIFKNCINKGDINMRGDDEDGIPLKCRVGGIVASTGDNPVGSKCFADINFKSTKSDNQVGGIIGFSNGSSVTAFLDLTFKGNINTNGSSGTNYTGGIVGNAHSNAKTFTNCTFSGTIRGANTGEGLPGLFCNSSSKVGYTFTNCKVGSGSIHKAGTSGTASATTITSVDQLLVGVLIGGKGASSCTVTDCAVVDPATITLN